eukprot:3961686-Alexandrium_andersonii.AAC.1
MHSPRGARPRPCCAPRWAPGATCRPRPPRMHGEPGAPANLHCAGTQARRVARHAMRSGSWPHSDL